METSFDSSTYIQTRKIIKNNVKNNAQNYKKSLDVSWATTDTAKNYKQVMEDCITYPTSGRIAKYQFVKMVPYEYSDTVIWRNEQLVLNNDKQAKNLTEIYKGAYKKIYHRTKKAREYIIKNNRINFDYVTKSKGYGLVDRIRILFTRVK